MANVVAPEHLEILTDDAGGAPRPWSTSAGAVFLGPMSPASVGDYLAGPNHVLPTNRTARFASALRVDDFRRHIHAVTVDRAGPRGARAGTSSPWPRPKGCRPTPNRCGSDGPVRARSGRDSPPSGRTWTRSPATTRPRSRWWRASTPTSRPCRRRPSGSTPSGRASPKSTSTGIRTGTPPSCAGRWPASHGVRPEQVFCANGSNEVLQLLLLAYGGPGPGRRPVRADLLAAPPDRPDHRHPGGRRPAHRGLPARPRRGRSGWSAAHDPVITFLCSPNNPTGRADTPDQISSVLSIASGLVVVDEAYGQFAPTSALELMRRGGPGTDRMAVVRTFSKTWSHGRAPARVPDRRPRRHRRLRAGVPAVPPRRGQAAGRPAGPRLRRRDGDHGGHVHARSGAGSPPRWPSSPSRPGRRMPTSSCSGRPPSTPTSCGPRLLEASVLVRDCSRWPGLAGCLRVTVGLPTENDRFLAALTKSLR